MQLKTQNQFFEFFGWKKYLCIISWGEFIQWDYRVTISGRFFSVASTGSLQFDLHVQHACCSLQSNWKQNIGFLFAFRNVNPVSTRKREKMFPCTIPALGLIRTVGLLQINRGIRGCDFCLSTKGCFIDFFKVNLSINFNQITFNVCRNDCSFK